MWDTLGEPVTDFDMGEDCEAEAEVVSVGEIDGERVMRSEGDVVVEILGDPVDEIERGDVRDELGDKEGESVLNAECDAEAHIEPVLEVLALRDVSSAGS